MLSFFFVLATAYFGWMGFREADVRGWSTPPKKRASASPPAQPASPGAPSTSPSVASRPSASETAGLPWSRFSLGNATIESPLALSPIADERTAQQKQLEIVDKYKGATSAYAITFGHHFFPQLRGEIMLETFSRAVEITGATRYPSTTGAVIINGLRARRFDFDHRVASGGQHVRLVVFSKGNQAWAVQVESRQDTLEAEEIFQRMAYSLRPN